jgi:hypothetical protein
VWSAAGRGPANDRIGLSNWKAAIMTDDTVAAAFVANVLNEKTTIADRLLKLAEPASLFHAADSTGYADIQINGHRETLPIKGRGFRRWLNKAYFDATKRAPNAEALQQALSVIEARATFDAPERPVHLRVASLGDKLYLDLGDTAWRVIEVDANGWRVAKDASVRFRRPAGMLPLPMPRPGSVTALRTFLNLRGDEDWALACAWLRATLRDRCPYPILVLTGEQGSAKSTFCRLLRSMVDPNTAPLRALPREDRDLFIAANNGHVLCFDNVSSLSPWISDTICRLSTGGGFSVRQLYSDADEFLFDGRRPIILNGIEGVIDRPDAADRSVFLALDQIPDSRRKKEELLWAEFERAWPGILGGLLTDVARGLRRLPDVKLATLPRMADFATWAVACEGAKGSFEQAYAVNRAGIVESVLDSDSVAAALQQLMDERAEWKGNATELLAELSGRVSDRISKGKTWPVDGARLSGRLTRAAPFIRKSGIEIERLKDGKRTIVIRRADDGGISASGSSGPLETDDANGLRADTGPDATPAGARVSVSRSVNPNPRKSNGFTATDGADACLPLRSESVENARPRPPSRKRAAPAANGESRPRPPSRKKAAAVSANGEAPRNRNRGLPSTPGAELRRKN